MEAFSLLKYWRAGGTIVGLPSSTTDSTVITTTAVNTTTILATAADTSDEDNNNNNNEDEGPFFDLEFTNSPQEEEEEEEEEEDDVSEETNHNNQQHEENDDNEDEEEESEEDGEFKITLSPSNNEQSDANLSLSPSQDLFFKGKLVQLKPSSFFLNNTSEPNSRPQFTASLLKSATKFRVFMSGLKKPKNDSVAEKKKQKPNRIKFKVEEVPIVSLFTRDNSSKGNINKSQNQKQNNVEHHETLLSPVEEKRFSKEVVMHKYLKMVKPLYIRVSRRYSHGEKPSSGEKVEEEIVAAEGETVVESEENNAKNQSQSQKQGNNIPAGLRVVYKHLGKSRSASSAVAASPTVFVSSKRRDDSLLQQQDGIQGAILHCKRSFNASRECESSSQLPRSVSDPLREMSPEMSRKSSDKRLSG